ncbi:MAG: hypothetical protein RLZZ282_1254 [Verrucomicrobiota bacterium]
MTDKLSNGDPGQLDEPTERNRRDGLADGAALADRMHGVVVARNDGAANHVLRGWRPKRLAGLGVQQSIRQPGRHPVSFRKSLADQICPASALAAPLSLRAPSLRFAPNRSRAF